MVLFKYRTDDTSLSEENNLHSTMVLFKSISEMCTELQKSFTFHYGPIQINIFSKIIVQM